MRGFLLHFKWLCMCPLRLPGLSTALCLRPIWGACQLNGMSLRLVCILLLALWGLAWGSGLWLFLVLLWLPRLLPEPRTLLGLALRAWRSFDIFSIAAFFSYNS